MKLQPLLAGVMVFCIGTVPVTFGASFSGSEKEQMQEQGMPVPGTAGDQESTKKQRDPSRAQGSEQNAQVTMGGSKYSVSGEIRKIENEYFFVKDEESGDEVRLLVNKDTNLDCSAASTQGSQAGITKRQSSEQMAPEASERQKEQGQKKDETAMGSGFNIGSCSFNSGDKIRAEVDDNGRVTMLKFVAADTEPAKSARATGESAGTGELAIPGRQDKPGQLDMTGGHGYPPKAYTILPVPLGEFKAAEQHALLNRPVKDHQGKTLGTLQSLIMDSNTGQVEYAVVMLQDKKTLREVPWKQIKTKQGSSGTELVLNKDYPIDPNLTGKEAQDRSPEIAKIMKDMENALAAPDLRPGQPLASASKEADARLIPPKDVKGEVVRGRVLKIEGQMFLIKERSGKEVRLRVDKQTQKGQVNLKDEPFKIGDKVEAYVTPDGHAFSISLMRAQGGIPGDPDAGG